MSHRSAQKNTGTLQAHCAVLFAIIFTALKGGYIQIGLVVNTVCVLGNTKLRQFGILLLGLVIPKTKKIKASGTNCT